MSWSPGIAERNQNFFARCERFLVALERKQYGTLIAERVHCLRPRRDCLRNQNEGFLSLLLLKFENIDPLGGLFARLLADVVAAGGPQFEADVVVPVPLHRQRERERGYNQAALIAKPLAKRLGLPYKSVLLTRIRPRPDKHILSMEERWESVRGAFATRPGSQIDNLRVLLLDDVMTTGATLDSCAKTLRDAGARSVVGVTVARARLRNPAAHLQ